MKKTLATTLLLTIFLSACGSEPENKMSDAEAKKFFTSLISVAVIGLFSVFILYDLKQIVDGGETNYVVASCPYIWISSMCSRVC